MSNTEKTKKKLRTRYLRLEWNCTRSEFFAFLKAVKNICERVEYFRARIGEVYLIARGISDEGDLYGVQLELGETVEDVLFTHRKEIRVLARLSKRPQPEKNYSSKWIEVTEDLLRSDSAATLQQSAESTF